MQVRAERVADVINAPTLKDAAVEGMVKSQILKREEIANE